MVKLLLSTVCMLLVLVPLCAADLHVNYSIMEGISGLVTTNFEQIGYGYYFVENKEKLNFYGAAHYCRRLGADLVSIETASELQYLSFHLREIGYPSRLGFWLSGNDLEREGSYYWLGTGQPMDYANWAPGQPDNSGGVEHCIHMYYNGTQYVWNDIVCTSETHFICEALTPKTITLVIW